MNFREIQARHLKNTKQGSIKPSKELRSEIHECLMCDNEVDPMEFYKGMPLCWVCVDYVINVNSYLRSGEFDSWEKQKRQTPKYTKKKITHELKKQVFERDEYRCKHCGTHLDLSADHIKPESWGGETTLENLQTLCRSCNSKKNNRYEG